MSAARGRLGQDLRFTILEVAGRPLRRLAAIHAADGELLCLYLEVDRPGCHRLFLDAGLAFWEDWGELPPDDAEEARDLIAAWDLEGAVVSAARAFPDPRGPGARIELDLGPHGVVALESIAPQELDAPTALRRLPPRPR